MNSWPLFGHEDNKKLFFPCISGTLITKFSSHFLRDICTFTEDNQVGLEFFCLSSVGIKYFMLFYTNFLSQIAVWPKERFFANLNSREFET